MRARATAAAAACLLGIVAAGCGGDGDDGKADKADKAAPAAADLTVTLQPTGPDGPVRRRRIQCERLAPTAREAACRRLAGLTPAQLKPVPASTACTGIYGGPAVARVRGELLGKRVDAHFDLTNGCEIERWDRNRVLLDDAPAGG